MRMSETENLKPGWVRPDGAIRYASVGRTTLYDWIRRGLVESQLLGEPGKGRCMRLINLASLDACIRDPQAAELRAKNGGG